MSVESSPTEQQHGSGTAPSPRGSLPKPPPDLARHTNVGQIVEVVVTAVLAEDVEVKLADGRPGVTKKSDFVGEPMPAIGDRIQVAMLARDDPKRRVVVSRAWARTLVAWDALEQAKAAGAPLTGPVVKVVKGGVVVDLGVRSFLPSSMIDEDLVEDLQSLIGQEFTVLVHELDRGNDRVVVNRRELLRRQRREAQRAAFSSIKVGDRRVGTVVELVPYGAYVEIDGARGLIHASELSWERVGSAASVLSLGESVEVVVIEVNKSKRRIGLSLRQTQPDPLSALELGSIVGGEVVKVLEYGLVVRLDDTSVAGLVHLSELSDFPGMKPDQIAVVGEHVHVKILSVDTEKRRVGLSIRQALFG